MLIIADKRIPKSAQQKLQQLGELYLLSTKGIVYDSISGHPDIFLHKREKNVVIAPQIPKDLLRLLTQTNYHLIEGSSLLGMRYPSTAHYNVVNLGNSCICNTHIADPKILVLYEEHLHVNQGYAACNFINGENLNICSDKGMLKSVEALYFSPEDIILKGQKHGFIGGAATVNQDKLYLLGSLANNAQAAEIGRFLEANQLELVELYSGPFVDGGGILFL